MNRKRMNLITIVPLALIIGFFFFLQLSRISLGMGIVAGLLMGVMTAGVATMSVLYREMLQKRAFDGKKQAGVSTESEQQRTIEIDLPYAQAFQLATYALQTLHDKPVPIPDDILIQMERLLPRQQYLHIKSSDREAGIIEAGLRAKVASVPDFTDFTEITIKLEAVDSATTQIHIESKPTAVASFFGERYDLGKNLHYVTHLAKFMRLESQTDSASARLSDSAITDDDAQALDFDNTSQQQTST
ncbi:MAG: hypothetical protein AAFQ52_06960 [Chloroflexota bacterium]